MKYRIRAAILALAINGLFLWAMDHGLRNPGCSTDEECMRLCPAGDIQCDGGPQG